jgi:hypothetical protein
VPRILKAPIKEYTKEKTLRIWQYDRS